MRTSIILTSISVILSIFCQGQVAVDGKLLLKDNWAIQSSKEINSDGKTISTTGFNVGKWYPTSVPATVLAALVANKVYSDPYYGTNIKKIPKEIVGNTKDSIEDNTFRVAWWYRTEFKLPARFEGKHTWLKFHSINYKANIWLNGKLTADTTTIEGAYRLFDLDISKEAVAGGINCLALEIFPPKKMDLSITWVDWNPTPPDRGMGIWYDVSVHSTGAVAIENPHVVTRLNLPSAEQARLTVSAEICNAGSKLVTGTLKGTIENISFSQEVTLGAGETKLVSFFPNCYCMTADKDTFGLLSIG